MVPAKATTALPLQIHAAQILGDIKNIIADFDIASLNRQVQACENLLTENPPIDVAVLGQFKSGKSSFINSLMGRAILPVGVIPVTTVITRLQYGQRELFYCVLQNTLCFPLSGREPKSGIEPADHPS